LERKIILKVFAASSADIASSGLVLWNISYRALLYKIRDAGLPSTAPLAARKPGTRRMTAPPRLTRRRLPANAASQARLDQALSESYCHNRDTAALKVLQTFFTWTSLTGPHNLFLSY